jgi:iron complex transport system substrate-binding protein
VISRVALANGAGVVIALGLALGAASHEPAVPGIATTSAMLSRIQVLELPGGRRGLRDATGEIVELRRYHRILAASTIADRLLRELAEHDRVVGVTAYGRAQSPWAYQLSDKPVLSGIDRVEVVLSLKPDLVVLNSHGQTAKVARLREQGIEVFDLGEARGAADLIDDIHVVAILLGHPVRGERLAAAWQRRFAAVDASLCDRPRKRAMYLSTYGGKVFGGTRGSSYGDVIAAAGLVDIAAIAYEGWPQYSPEQLLRLDPDLVVTKPGMGAEICRLPGVNRMRFCSVPGGFVEVDGALLDEPGLPMLDAAEQVFSAVYSNTR